MENNFAELRQKVYASINGTKGNLIKLSKSRLLSKSELALLEEVIGALEKLRVEYYNNRGKKLVLAEPKSAKVKQPMKYRPMKYVGVIARNLDDFLNWKKEHKHYPKFIQKNVMRMYVWRNTMYVALTRPDHACGFSLDKLIETETAYLNSDYEKVKETSKPALKTNGICELR